MTDRQAAAYGAYSGAVEHWRGHRLLGSFPRPGGLDASADSAADETEADTAVEADADRKERILHAAAALAADAARKTLRGRKRADFDAIVVPYLAGTQRPPQQDRLDQSMVLRAIVKRVLDLGWTDERFAEFDGLVTRVRGEGHGAHAERIGKKHQWIAYHEMLARVADRFEYCEPFRERADERYAGPWQAILRDIDPSVLERAPQEDDPSERAHGWWVPHQHSEWQHVGGLGEWVQQQGDLPDPRKMLDVTSPGDQSRWIPLRGTFGWEEPTSAADDTHYMQRCRLALHVQAYVVRSEHLEAVRRWCAAQEPTRWSMPEPVNVHEAFHREFPWAFAWGHEYPSCDEWVAALDQELPHPVFPATAQFSLGVSGDCSGAATRIAVPSPWLCRRLALRHGGADGAFTDAGGATVVVDPSVTKGGSQAVLIRADQLRAFLARGDRGILWEARWLKQVIGGWNDLDAYGSMDVCGIYTMDESGGFSGSAKSEHTPPSAS